MMNSYRLEKQLEAEVAPFYDGLYNTLYYLENRKHLIQQFLERDFSDGPVCDLGCGTGSLLSQMEKKGIKSLYGLDLSQEMIAIAKQKLKNVKFVKGIAQAIPFKDSSFIAVLGFSVLHHLEDFRMVFSEIYRILKPGGVFIFGEPYADFILTKKKGLGILLRCLLYPLIICFNLKNNAKILPIPPSILHFSTPTHRNLTLQELNSVLHGEKWDVRIDFQCILSTFFITNLFGDSPADQFFYKILKNIDGFLAKRYRGLEIFIYGVKKSCP